jgi:hypothetical protein
MADATIIDVPDPDVDLLAGVWEIGFFRIESYGCGTNDDPIEVREQGVAVTHRDYLGLDD